MRQGAEEEEWEEERQAEETHKKIQKKERNLYSNSEREGQMLKQNYYCRFACP